MILYYVPGACSLAVHVALIEAGISYKLVSVDREKQTADGRDFLAINPKGYVPALELDDGTVLTENLAILAYIAHQTGTLLAADGLPRWRALEATSFMTTELHRNFKPFFNPDTTQAQKDKSRQALVRRFGTLAEQLGDNAFLTGDQMTIADSYLFVMLTWAAMFGLEVSKPLETYLMRLKQLPSVVRALTEEGLA